MAGTAVVVFPTLVGIPGRLSRSCAGWLTLGAGLELLSAGGYVMVFALTFCGGMAWRGSARVACGALAASRLLPGGGVTGPALAAATYPPARERTTLPARVMAFFLLTNAPGMIVLAALGALLWTGALPGPRSPILTLVPAVFALALLAGTYAMAMRASPRRGPPALGWRRVAAAGRYALTSGAREAATLIRDGNWRLLGALANYGFDSVAFWATLRAFGHNPALSAVMIAFLVGGLGSALPLPAGIGGTELGLVASLVLYGAASAPGAVAVVFAYRVLSTGIPLVIGAIALRRLCCPLLAGRSRRRRSARER